MQGIFFGARDFSGGLGPLVFEQIQAIFIKQSTFHYFPSAPFVFGCFFLFAGLLLSFSLPDVHAETYNGERIVIDKKKPAESQETEKLVKSS